MRLSRVVTRSARTKPTTYGGSADAVPVYIWNKSATPLATVSSVCDVEKRSQSTFVD